MIRALDALYTSAELGHEVRISSHNLMTWNGGREIGESCGVPGLHRRDTR